MPDVLIKLATFQTVFFGGSGGKGSDALVGKPEPHPVKAFLGSAQLGFVRMQHETEFVQTLFQYFYGTPEFMAGRGDDDEIIHITCVAHACHGRDFFIDLVQVKGGQQRTERAGAGNALDGHVKIACVLHRVVQELPQQRAYTRAGNADGELIVKPVFVDVCVVTADIGAKDEGRSGVTQKMMNATRTLFAAALAPDVFTGVMDRKMWCQQVGEGVNNQRVAGGPPAVRAGNDAQRTKMVPPGAKRLQERPFSPLPVKMQVPYICIRRVIFAGGTQPGTGRIQYFRGE